MHDPCVGPWYLGAFMPMRGADGSERRKGGKSSSLRRRSSTNGLRPGVLAQVMPRRPPGHRDGLPAMLTVVVRTLGWSNLATAATPSAPHDRLGQLVEHRGHRLDLVQAGAVEGYPESGPGRLHGVAVVPGVHVEPPADLDAAGARHPIGIGLSPVKPMNSPVSATSSTQSPYPCWSNRSSMRSTSLSLASRSSVCEKNSMVSGSASRAANGLAVGVEPAPHQQPVRADSIESAGLRHLGPPVSRTQAPLDGDDSVSSVVALRQHRRLRHERAFQGATHESAK
jgi:hypothetical protein